MTIVNQDSPLLRDCDEGEPIPGLRGALETAIHGLMDLLDTIDAPDHDLEPTDELEGDGDCDDEDGHDREQPPEGGLG